MKMYLIGFFESTENSPIYCYLTTNPAKKFKSILCGKDKIPIDIDSKKDYSTVEYKSFEGDDFREVNRLAQEELAKVIANLGDRCINTPIVVKNQKQKFEEPIYKYEYRLNQNTVLCANNLDDFNRLKMWYGIQIK